MCGIAGFLSPDGRRDGDALAERMSFALRHRGPDDGGGVWTDAASGIAIAQRRLAIIDVSPGGAQPMASHDGRWQLVFNGECYNFQDVRTELEGEGVGDWRGHSDTDVVLEAIALWGLERALAKLIGMFAFALWDRQDRVLHLARDRMGEKPLYYGLVGRDLAFGSELKALHQHPSWRPEIDREALGLMLRFNNVPAPHSIYKGIFKLPAGSRVAITREHVAARSLPAPVKYWDLGRVIAASRSDPLRLSDVEAVDKLETLLRDAVRRQMVSDVPLGAFLSGGVDSSLIVSLMQAQSPRPVKTFTIGFHEAGMNEAPQAKAVAKHLGTDHEELYVTPEETREVIHLLPRIYDEPFADASQIPTYLVSRMARRQVTVSLSGDGGDELFGGYTRYAWGGTIWRTIRHLPLGARRLMSRAMGAMPVDATTSAFSKLRPVLPRSLQAMQMGDKLMKLSTVLQVSSAEELYTHLMSQWRWPSRVVVGASDAVPPYVTGGIDIGSIDEFVDWMMAADAGMYLPDDILVKVDRAAMAVSLETRVPFLDHRVVEFAWRLPQDMKVRGADTKWALRQLLYRHVPRSLIERPKMGFGAPIDQWLRGPLRDWAEALLDESRLKREGFFHPGPVRRYWEDHLIGRHNWQYPLWNVLMFQTWHEHWAAEDSAAPQSKAA